MGQPMALTQRMRRTTACPAMPTENNPQRRQEDGEQVLQGRSIVARMTICHRGLSAAMLALLALPLGAAGQDASPAPATSPSVPPGVSSASPGASPSSAPTPTTLVPVGARLRWVAVRDRDVMGAGVLFAAATLGDEVVALAPRRSAQGQTRIVALATSDGATWTRRGQISITGDIADLLADGDALLAVGWDEGATVWRSIDGGRTWATPADAAPFAGGADGLPGSAESAEVLGISRGPAGLLAVGLVTDPDTLVRRAAAWRSTDGVAWERLPGVSTLPSLHAVAGDAVGYVSVGSSVVDPRPTRPADIRLLRWSPDGATWTDASADVRANESIEGVSAVPGGFVAWGRAATAPQPGTGPAVPAITWTSPDGLSWTRHDADPALASVDLDAIRSLDGGALIMAIGGVPDRGIFSFPRLGDTWRRDRIKGRDTLCVRDVASVGAILVAVGGTCGEGLQRGRAWTAPLES